MMLQNRSLFLFVPLFLFCGCTSITVRPIDTSLELRHACIKDCSDKCFDSAMMGIIRDGFQRHGITTQEFSGEVPSECEYHLTYYCERTWDMAMYMHHAELRLYRAKEQIGYAEYHLKGQGGFSLMKWESTKNKIDPVIDQLLKNYPINEQTAAVE